MEREKIYECEVKRRRTKVGGGYEPYWKVKTLADALADMDTEFRCKDCGGAVKLLGRNAKAGAVPFVEHKHASDAAYCISGLAFRVSTDGREARPSSQPVRLGYGDADSAGGTRARRRHQALMAIERETKMYECEVERRRVKAGGGYEAYWKVKVVADAVVDEDTKFRCKDCGGAVKLFKSHKVGGPPAHVEHKDKNDSEYCVSGLWFKKATDGREARRSDKPVE